MWICAPGASCHMFTCTYAHRESCTTSRSIPVWVRVTSLALVVVCEGLHACFRFVQATKMQGKSKWGAKRRVPSKQKRSMNLPALSYRCFIIIYLLLSCWLVVAVCVCSFALSDWVAWIVLFHRPPPATLAASLDRSINPLRSVRFRSFLPPWSVILLCCVLFDFCFFSNE